MIGHRIFSILKKNMFIRECQRFLQMIGIKKRAEKKGDSPPSNLMRKGGFATTKIFPLPSSWPSSISPFVEG
jgi:hypothetical protein